MTAAVMTCAIILSLSASEGEAYIVGTSPFAPVIYIFNDPSWTIFSADTLTLAGFTVVGANSVSWNPVDGQYYAIVRVTGFPRRLVTVDPETGACTDIGSMGANFSSLTFTPSGKLYAIAGQGAGPGFAQNLFSVNTLTGAPTLLAGPFTLGADGEVIAFNKDDGYIYHWSGNATANMGRIDTATFVETVVPQSGTTHNEIFGAVYIGSGTFYITDISSRALTITTGGLAALVASGLPDDIRGLGFGDPVLPVELVSFTSSVTGRNVTLEWTTSEEVNNAGFEIQRSDSRGQWVRAGYVRGNGTAAGNSSYSFTDKGLSSGTYSYRLKQTDYNGQFEYFELSNEVFVGVPSRFELSQNYPNPFNPSTKISFDLPVGGNAELVVFDMSGSEVATLVNENLPAGYYTIDFNASSLSSGVYFFRLVAGDNVATRKMALIK